VRKGKSGKGSLYHGRDRDFERSGGRGAGPSRPIGLYFRVKVARLAMEGVENRELGEALAKLVEKKQRI